jgi:transcriptional regulator with XRE-family HTH domain
LAAFLRAQRSRLRPTDVGLLPDMELSPAADAGLWREEIAELVGVSQTRYTWLEQGRKIAASPQVVDALARALLLDPGQYRHLRPAGLADPVAAPRPRETCRGLQQLVDSMMPSPAVIHDGHFDFVVWNDAYLRLRLDPAGLEPDRRNMVWMMFTHKGNRAAMRNWEPAARGVLSQFRALVGRRPDDQRSAEVVAGLTEASAEFRTWWSVYPVQEFRAATIGIDIPHLGPVDLELYQLRRVEDPDLLRVLQLPPTEDDRARISSYLA